MEEHAQKRARVGEGILTAAGFVSPRMAVCTAIEAKQLLPLNHRESGDSLSTAIGSGARICRETEDEDY
jgi:hypothetical protein